MKKTPLRRSSRSSLLLATALLAAGGTAFAAPAVVELGTLDGTNGTAFHNANAGDFVGRSVAGIGDVNNDGYDDFAVGGERGDANSLADGGVAYVVFGGAGLGAAEQLGFPSDPSRSMQIAAPAASSLMGQSVAGLGDVKEPLTCTHLLPRSFSARFFARFRSVRRAVSPVWGADSAPFPGDFLVVGFIGRSAPSSAGS